MFRVWGSGSGWPQQWCSPMALRVEALPLKQCGNVKMFGAKYRCDAFGGDGGTNAPKMWTNATSLGTNATNLGQMRRIWERMRRAWGQMRRIWVPRTQNATSAPKFGTSAPTFVTLASKFVRLATKSSRWVPLRTLMQHLSQCYTPGWENPSD